MFQKVNQKQSFPKLEEEILKFWQNNDTFNKSIETRKDSEEFNFYDGPPFATGTPHYGHILAWTIKDVIPRYQTMKWKKVERKFGWDCHWLPIENIVEKKLKISGKDDIENKIWVYEFNETCKENVFWYVDEWKKTVERMWRWVDMENDYKTMDTSFMESVWRVFKNIYNKWLVYEWNRIVPYCPRCTTPLSNFEVNQWYKDKQSKTVTVKFKVKSENKLNNYREASWNIIRNEDWKILLWMKTNWLFSFPWWKMENWEDHLSCAIRELKEETWIDSKELELFSCNFSQDKKWQYWKECSYILNVKNDINIINNEIETFKHWDFFSIEELKKLKEEEVEWHSFQVIRQILWEIPINEYHINWNKYILAWTTTPWTLYANLWLAVWADIDYVELVDKSNWDTYILAKEKVKDYYKKEGNYKIIKEFKWTELVWIKYEPIFQDFNIELNEMKKDLWSNVFLWKNSWSVVLGHHVTIDIWTWIVHIAPAYGEDDFIIWEKEKLGFVSHIDNSWKTCNLLNNNDKFVFDFNEIAIQELKEKKLAIHIWTIDHSYPHCWRCDTPLIYRWISAWYVAVEKIRDKMVANNQKMNWVPDAIKNWRFWNWLDWAKDWNISRNRYWWSAIPVWQSEDKKNEICIGSIEELYESNKVYGQIEKKDGKYFYSNSWKEVDLHKHFVDDLFVKNEKNFKAKNVLWIHWFKRDPETLVDFFEWTKKNLEKDWINVFAPIFEEGPSIDYSNWKKVLDWIDLNKFDTFLCHSLGCKVAQEYIIENKIKLKRIVFVWASKNASTPETQKFSTKLKHNFKELKKYVDEIIFIKSVDDPVSNYEHTKELATTIWANLLTTKWDWHYNVKESSIIEAVVNFWMPLLRIPEVLDCWFESWAMPYASKHYPFENSENFKFPADFIAEWLDQTRWWFYTLIILSTALFDSPSALNTIVNWIILAEDWKKMSKSLKNYPDPKKIFDNYWADAMRFYLMNSPVVEWQDLRFSEFWVEEVVKKVILPFWNTYSFFTTYANIDKFETKKWWIFYCRHGKTNDNNVLKMSWWDIDTPLNEIWKKQAISAWKKFNLSWEKIDVIIHSPLSRAKETAKIITNELWFDWEIIEDDRLIELKAGIFSWMTHDEVRQYAKEKFNLTLIWVEETRRFFKDFKYNKAEDLWKFDERIKDLILEIQEKYKWKNVLLVAHNWTYRPINRYLNNLDFDDAHYNISSIPNATIFKMPTSRQNILDKWIISELNKLTQEVTSNLDNYKINEATRPIVAFMDNLTNWYIRRSRKRFWKSENDNDKIEAYETLYEVLVEVSKLLCPFMPFVTEYIYKNLTGKESVHLEVFPFANASFIFKSLNSQFATTTNLINLWLACRERNHLRVRQPLSNLKISEKIDDYYIDILKDELNVKNVSYFSSEEMPKQICKPNARLIWPKFWADVKFIISEAKKWNFINLDWWKVQVWDFILEDWEFEIAFEKTDWIWEIESWFWMVISLDTTLSDELIQEWLARDLVRHIQESRKEANFDVDNRIIIEIITKSEEINNSIAQYKNYIENETLSKITQKIVDTDYSKEIDLDEYKLTIHLKR